MKRLIVDMSSLCWACLYAGTDEEHGHKAVAPNGREVLVNSARHGYENAINALVAAWEKNGITPKDTILVVEHGHSRGMRERVLPGYKAGRDDSRPKDYYVEFEALKTMLGQAVLQLGGAAVTRENMEADDVIAYLAQKLEGEIVILSNDGDLAACMNERVTLWKAGEAVRENPYGPWDVRWIPVYKALVGDASDKIPGAKGFGNKAWLDLLCAFGEDGLELMEGLIQARQLDQLEEDVQALPSLRKIMDAADSVYRSYAAGKLYPELVETFRVPMAWQAGYVRERREIADDRLRPYAGIVRLVTAENYAAAMEFMREKLGASEWVALDLETYTSDESDEWIEAAGGGVDVLDSRITGMGLTFGANQQFNLYFQLAHKEEAGATNITLDQFKDVLEALRGKDIVIANAAGFELPVLRRNVGDIHGEYFLPHVTDMQLEASYVDENLQRGLKFLSKHYLGYDQVNYDEVTQGRKMNQLTGHEVLAYGADDTRFTSALHTHFRRLMELEGTTATFAEVESDVQYLLAYSFLEGVTFDFEQMLKIEAQDAEEFDREQAIFDAFLAARGYEGTVCPKWGREALEDRRAILDIYQAITGEELKSAVRTPSKLFKLIAVQPHEDAPLLAKFMEDGNIEQLNDWARTRFQPRAAFDLGSPKQVKGFLYGLCGLPVRLINKLTDNERANKPELCAAVSRFNRVMREEEGEAPLTAEEMEILRAKATTDDDAVAFALKFDVEKGSELEAALHAFQKLKEINTRRSLFYGPYRKLLYWQDRRMHPSFRQSSTVTRRFTASKPNVTQLSKGGEGPQLRSCYVAHKPGAVVCSIDFNSQELVQQAVLSQDRALLSCYFGDERKDLHSITGARMAGIPYEKFYADLHGEDHALATIAKDWRRMAKPVNFGAAYSATAMSISRSVVCSLKEAQTYLDAKYAAFPRYEKWVEETKQFAREHGYVTTPRGVRRHMGEDMRNSQSWIVDKAARAAGNFPIQGGAGEQTKLAMGRIWTSGVLRDYDVQFYFSVHDEVVFSVAAEDAVEVIRIIHNCMTVPYFKEYPAGASISLGPNYAEQIEVGDEVDPQAITAAIEQVLGEAPRTLPQPAMN